MPTTRDLLSNLEGRQSVKLPLQEQYLNGVAVSRASLTLSLSFPPRAVISNYMCAAYFSPTPVCTYVVRRKYVCVLVCGR